MCTAKVRSIIISKYFLLIGLVSAPLFSSCEEPDSIGLGLIEEEQFDLIYVDTLTVRLSTVLFDSVATSATGRLLAGHRADSIFGTITANAFFQIGLDSLNNYPDEERATYDRAVLTLYYDNYSYYDTIQLQTFQVYPLINELEYRDDGKLYNTSFQDNTGNLYDSTKLLGSFSWHPKPHQENYVEIPLDDSLGRELFILAQGQNDTIQSENDFQEKYKGFALVPELQNSAMLGFSNRTGISVYFEEGGEEKSLQFSVSNNVYFSQVVQDRSTTKYAPLTQQRNELPADASDNTVYLQGGTGVGIRVEFPFIKSLLTLSNELDITDANLILKLPKGSYSGSTPLPQNLTAYQVDGLNRIVGEFSTTFNLYLDQEFKEESYYLIPVTGFLKAQLAQAENNENALLITLPGDAMDKTTNRIVANGNTGENSSRLEAFVLRNLSIQK